MTVGDGVWRRQQRDFCANSGTLSNRGILLARGSRSSHLGAVGAGLLRVGDELPAVEPRVEGFLDGVGQGLLLLIVWGRRVESGEIGLSGRLKWILRGFGGRIARVRSGADGSRTFVPTSMYPASLKTPRYASFLLRLLFMAPSASLTLEGERGRIYPRFRFGVIIGCYRKFNYEL